ncbi:hypothetical protein [Streptomyces sp. JHA26]|uniref:hypothetical protein n=1 Tax=Streptomyces sp. JHA26 TaxID=1917143 RepID=UPI00098B1058|nr:hypothetical protein [Streptomyces sp. JHA26]
MTAPGRHMPCSSPLHHRSPTTRRTTRAVQQAGRLLCWSLAAGMTTAATDLIASPRTPWWEATWPLPWYLTCLTIPAWALLRAHEKAALSAPDHDQLQDSWDQAA